MYECFENMPESGQFHAIWVYNNQVWGASFKKEGDRWTRYDESEGEMVPIRHPRDHIPFDHVTDVQFITVGI